MKKFSAIILLIIGLGLHSQAQDIHFAQFDKAPLMLNPGMAGLGKGFNRANLNYRNQWGPLNNAYSTMAFSADMPILSAKMNVSTGYLGIGLDFYSDDAGDANYKTTHFGFTLSGVLLADKNSRVSLGLKGSFEQQSISPDKVSWDNQWTGTIYDPSLPSGETFSAQTNSFFDLAAGMGWRYVQPNIGISAFDKLKATAGVAYFHMLSPNRSFYSFSDDKTHGRIVAHGRGTFGLRDQYITISPGFMFQKQGPHNELIVGGIFKYLFRSDTKYTGFEGEKAIGIGIHVRGKDALIPSFIFELGGFELGLNYDYTISTLQNANNGVGGFEVSLQWVDTYGKLFKQGDKHVLYLE